MVNCESIVNSYSEARKGLLVLSFDNAKGENQPSKKKTADFRKRVETILMFKTADLGSDSCTIAYMESGRIPQSTLGKGLTKGNLHNKSQ